MVATRWALACCALAAAAALTACSSSSRTGSATQPPSAAQSLVGPSSPAPTVVAGSSPASMTGSSSATVRVTVTAAGSTVQLVKGGSVQLELPASNGGGAQTTTYGVAPGGGIVSAVAGTAGLFTATADGTTKIEVTQRPVCVAGQACVAHILLVGSVTVTVRG